jgi:filamentous hemagglutinin family protein
MYESTARSRHPDSLAQAFLWALLPTLLLILNAPDATYAQVATNITSSTLPACPAPCGAGVTIVTPPVLGTTVTTITGGARPGNGPNLFHSFGQFNVGTGDIANFLNDTHLPTSNILSRVTGGNPSQIYGTIQTTDFPAANLFLMNPAGVLFGANAVLDLGAVTGSAVRQPGSFYATTADYLKLVNGAGTSPFYADPAQASVLSVAPVAAFGFSAPDPVSITLEGSTLMVGQGQTLSIVGGNKPFNKTIQEDPLIEQAVPSGVTVTGGALSAPGGTINLVSVASPGEVLVPSFKPNTNIDVPQFTSFASVSLAPGSNINLSGASTVSIRGGQIVLSVNDAVLTTAQTAGPPETISLSPGSSIVTSNSGTDPGADVQLIASNVQMDGASLKSETKGAEPGGNITVNGRTLSLTNVAKITTQNFGLGHGGDVTMTADSLTIENASTILINPLPGNGAGRGGNLVLNVGKLSLLGGLEFGPSLIQSVNKNGGSGLGGNVTVQGQGADSSVVLSGGSQILSFTEASGAGGQISITATSLNLSGSDFFDHGLVTTIGSSTTGTGHGGDIVARVQQLQVLDGATISSHSVRGSSSDPSAPSAGAGGMVTVQGLAGSGSMADSVRLSGKSTGIFSDSVSGLPGDITVNAGILTITNGAAISAGSAQITGRAGQVAVTADSIVISAGGQIFSQSFAQDAGQVTIKANQLTLDNGSIVTKASSPIGGHGGDVVLNVGSASLTNGATINSSSDGTGNAGNITINSDSNVILQNSSIITEASQASGGEVTVIAPDMVQLFNSTISTSVAGSSTDTAGGNITIDPQFVILQNSQIIAQANAGSGGAIDITAGVFLASPNSVVDASSTLGVSGTVNIQSPVQNVGGQLTPMSQQFSSAAALLAQRCAARVADGKFSTFVVAGREGLPVEPGGFLASPSVTAELLGSNLSARYPHTPIAAVTGLFQEYGARPIQLAKFGNACH